MTGLFSMFIMAVTVGALLAEYLTGNNSASVTNSHDSTPKPRKIHFTKEDQWIQGELFD
ncbi:MAG: hypothetical protein IJ159_04910 [Prevotella sp.]|nr:hypothetical protein [Prevotella sp.]